MQNAITSALAACIDAMTPGNNAVEREAVELASEALLAIPYPATSLETAACAWEAVLDMETDGEGRASAPEDAARGAQIRAAREAMGSSSLRLTVLGWVDAIDAAWRKADTDDGRQPQGGEYDSAFDWDFVPVWIVENIDWSDPHAPTVRKPVAAQAVEAAPAAKHVTANARAGLEAFRAYQAAPREMVAGDIMELRTYTIDVWRDESIWTWEGVAGSEAEACEAARQQLESDWDEEFPTWRAVVADMHGTAICAYPAIMAERIPADELARLRASAGESVA